MDNMDRTCKAYVENILLSNGTHSMCPSCIERAVLAVECIQVLGII